MVLIKAFIKISHPRIQFIFYIFYTLFIELELRLEISALLQSSNLNVKPLAFSPKVSALKYFSMLQVGTFGHADKKISAVFIWWDAFTNQRAVCTF